MKIVKNYTYHGLGFPVQLENVEMCFMYNDWHPLIDVQKVADDVIRKLATQEEKLSDEQIRFIRSYFSIKQ